MNFWMLVNWFLKCLIYSVHNYTVHRLIFLLFYFEIMYSAHRTSCCNTRINEFSHFPSLLPLYFSIHLTLSHLFFILAVVLPGLSGLPRRLLRARCSQAHRTAASFFEKACLLSWRAAEAGCYQLADRYSIKQSKPSTAFLWWSGWTPACRSDN